MTSRTAPGLHRPLVALGVALLATTALLSAYYSRLRPQLDWSNYLVGILATVGLLGIAVLVATRPTLARPGAASDLAAWPGAFGAAAAGVMVGVGLDDRAVTAYAAGGVVLLISVVGWLLTWRDPFVVSGVAGFFVVVAEAFDDLVGVDGDERLWPVALALTVFALGVTAAAWLLPARVAAGVTAGVIATAGLASLTGVLAITGLFRTAFSGFDDATLDAPAVGFGVTADPFEHVSTDTWITLCLAALLMVFWAVCAAMTGAVGFRVLVVAAAVAVTPLATIALQVEHPTWWGVVLGAVGGAALLAALLAALRQPAPAGDQSETPGP